MIILNNKNLGALFGIINNATNFVFNFLETKYMIIALSQRIYTNTYEKYYLQNNYITGRTKELTNHILSACLIGLILNKLIDSLSFKPGEFHHTLINTSEFSLS